MAKFNSLAFACMFLFFFGSCQSLEQIPIDYIQPAEITFPPELRKVGIVNNCSIPADSTLILATSDQRSLLNLINMRGAIAYANGDPRIVTESLAEEIANQNYFETVVICDSALRANDKIARESTLSQEEVRTLTSNLGVDLIISLEGIRFITGRSIYYPDDYDTYQVTIDLKAFPTIKTYLPTLKKPMNSLTTTDSIYWEEVGTKEEINERMISEKQLLKEAAEFAGRIPVKYLIPFWKKDARFIYANGSIQMRDAAVYAYEGSWDEAYKLWQEVFNDTKRKKKKMKAAVNIAVYYEMKDSIAKAVEWATTAQKIAKKIDKVDEIKDTTNINFWKIPNYYQTTLYVTELNKRYASLPKIKMQMSRFNDDF
ncbi:DUF6340 family protein [Bacteroides sp.]|uniref:DUF6340 family protein n=1 Tax=Bacteroides sp. TaxID=29523 RepID=UPI002628D312|nr:DUF6340 family protein [Bacteroides sp.]MDD3036767.1 DUF6340 family protein [Bacteroides sp.]